MMAEVMSRFGSSFLASPAKVGKKFGACRIVGCLVGDRPKYHGRLVAIAPDHLLEHEDGEGLPWLQRVKDFLPNGIHAVVIVDELVRVEMFRYETTYHLLISKHWLQRGDKERPELKSRILFLGRNGSLDTELWGKDAAFRGGAMPHFYARSGEFAPPDATWTNATLKITEAACCCGCRHSHLLEAGMSASSSSSPVPTEQAEKRFEFENEGMPA
jgi:hypothetical protein